MSPRAPHQCSGCRTVSVPAGTRFCSACRPAQAARRGTTAQRGYGSQHQGRRKDWTRSVAAGLVDCRRCGERIKPGEPWDLGHDDVDRSRPSAPEHARQCNRRAAGHSAH